MRLTDPLRPGLRISLLRRRAVVVRFVLPAGEAERQAKRVPAHHRDRRCDGLEALLTALEIGRPRHLDALAMAKPGNEAGDGDGLVELALVQAWRHDLIDLEAVAQSMLAQRGHRGVVDTGQRVVIVVSPGGTLVLRLEPDMGILVDDLDFRLGLGEGIVESALGFGGHELLVERDDMVDGLDRKAAHDGLVDRVQHGARALCPRRKRNSSARLIESRWRAVRNSLNNLAHQCPPLVNPSTIFALCRRVS